MNELTTLAREMSKLGRGGDTMLAHISPEEAYLLKTMGGAGTINPYTGLPEYRFRIRIPRFIQQIAPVVAIAVPFLAPAIIPAIGASVLSSVGATTLATSTIAATAAGAAVVSGATTLIATGDIETAAKAAALSAVSAGIAGNVAPAVNEAVTAATGSAVAGQLAGSTAGAAASAIATGRDPVEAAATALINTGVNVASTQLASIGTPTTDVTAPTTGALPTVTPAPEVPVSPSTVFEYGFPTPPVDPPVAPTPANVLEFGFPTPGLSALTPPVESAPPIEVAPPPIQPALPTIEPVTTLPEPIAPPILETFAQPAAPTSGLASVSTDAEAQPGGFYGQSPLAEAIPVPPPIADITPIAPSTPADLGETFGDMTPVAVPEVGFPATEPITPAPADIISGYATSENVFEYGAPTPEPFTPAPADVIPGYATPENVLEYGFPETAAPLPATPENVFEYGFTPTEPITPAPADVIPNVDYSESFGDVMKDISPGIEGFGEAADEVGGALSGTYIPGIEGFGEAADEVGGAGVSPVIPTPRPSSILDFIRRLLAGSGGSSAGGAGQPTGTDYDRNAASLISQGLAMLEPGSKQFSLPGSLEATYLPAAPMSQQQQFLQQVRQLYPQLEGTDDRFMSTIAARTGGHIPEFITGKTGFYVQGRGDGQSDDIPAMLADGEYVFDADTVSALGNGSNKAGAAVLDKMRERIREHKRSAPTDKIPPKAKSPLEYLKG